jgi:hypothetical protein
MIAFNTAYKTRAWQHVSGQVDSCRCKLLARLGMMQHVITSLPRQHVAQGVGIVGMPIKNV